MVAILKFFKRHLPNRVGLSRNLMEALEQHRDSELLKSFLSNIQDGRNLEILQKTSPPKPCQIEPKLDGRHGSNIEIQNC